MYVIRKYDDLSLMDTKKERFEQVLKNKSLAIVRNRMKTIAWGNENGSWVLIQISGEVTIILQKIINKF